jgi:ssDNA-binding Zn-finger/Zn-ribbon topoisomerase 1
MVKKFGRFGKYLKCLNCGASRDAEPKASSNGANGAESTAGGEEVAEPEACELCGKPMQLKRGRFGPFLGCTGYPEMPQHPEDREKRRGRTGASASRREVSVDGAQLVRRFGVSESLFPAQIIRSANTSSRSRPVLTVRGLVVRVKWSSGSRSAAKCFIAALPILTATEFIGTSPLLKLVQSAKHRFCGEDY